MDYLRSGLAIGLHIPNPVDAELESVRMATTRRAWVRRPPKVGLIGVRPAGGHPRAVRLQSLRRRRLPQLMDADFTHRFDHGGVDRQQFVKTTDRQDTRHR
jgi:hypothetical protein